MVLASDHLAAPSDRGDAQVGNLSLARVYGRLTT